MTTIGSTFYSTTTSHYAGANRSTSNANFTDQVEEATTQASETQPDKLARLLTELKDLKQHEVEMSPRDYLSATLTLKEQISTERLNAGEDLDAFGVRFEGRVFNLAGKLYGPGSLESAKVSDSETVDLPRYVTLGQNGVDIKA